MFPSQLSRKSPEFGQVPLTFIFVRSRGYFYFVTGSLEWRSAEILNLTFATTENPLTGVDKKLKNFLFLRLKPRLWVYLQKSPPVCCGPSDQTVPLTWWNFSGPLGSTQKRNWDWSRHLNPYTFPRPYIIHEFFYNDD